MLRRRLGATVSAMILAVHLGSPAVADPSVDQLSEIRELLAQNNVAALRSYLDTNPELLEGDSRLAVLLRRFVLESKHLPNLLSDSDPPSSSSPDSASPSAGPDNNGSY